MSDQEREEMSIIALTDEQGNEVEFELLDVVPYNGQEYIAIIPLPHTKVKMCVLKDSSCECREMTIAVVAIEVT